MTAPTITLGVSEDAPLARDGGLPTPEELTRLDNTVMDIHEFGYDMLLDRLATAFIAAYEPGGPETLAGCDFEYVGRYAYGVRCLVQSAEIMLEQARALAEYTEHLERAATTGYVNDRPPFGRFRGPYEPSDEAKQAWGLRRSAALQAED